MKILYISPSCPYCHVVLDFAAQHQIALDVRDITQSTNMHDLIAKGGKMQVPFLVDPEHDVALYESQDIVSYLQKQR